tara:strand:+ start:35 stop:172 length:138 start_codon:yes stop_codon:yes gene_type:complete
MLYRLSIAALYPIGRLIIDLLGKGAKVLVEDKRDGFLRNWQDKDG